jgi:hypothetical protein
VLNLQQQDFAPPRFESSRGGGLALDKGRPGKTAPDLHGLRAMQLALRKSLSRVYTRIPMLSSLLRLLLRLKATASYALPYRHPHQRMQLRWQLHSRYSACWRPAAHRIHRKRTRHAQSSRQASQWPASPPRSGFAVVLRAPPNPLENMRFEAENSACATSLGAEMLAGLTAEVKAARVMAER